MISNLRVGIPIIGDNAWLGGVYYIESLIKAVHTLSRHERPQIFLIVAEHNFGSIDLHRSIFPLIDGVLFIGHDINQAKTLLPKEFTHYRSYQELLSFIDFFYPVLGDVIPNVCSASWIFDFQHVHMPEFFSQAEIQRRNAAFQRISQFAKIVAFSSNDAKNDFHRLFPNSQALTRVLSFYTLTPDEWFVIDPIDVQKKYDLPDEFLLCSNQFYAHKNHARLFEALAEMLNRGHKMHLVCTGPIMDPRDPKYFPQIQTKIIDLGIKDYVHILGVIPRIDQIQIMRRCEAVIQPSLFEGWSTVVEDARALGKTIFLSDLPVHLEQSPNHSLFFHRHNSHDLADKISQQLPNLSPGPDLKREQQARSKVDELVKSFALQFCSIAVEAQYVYGRQIKTQITDSIEEPVPVSETAELFRQKDRTANTKADNSTDSPEAIVVATNLVPFNDQGQIQRQQLCIESISNLKPLGVIPLNICYEDEYSQPPGWNVMPVLKKSADVELKIKGKRKPFVTDLFDVASEWAEKSGIKWFAISNSDIIFTQELIHRIRKMFEEGYETLTVSRSDILKVDPATGHMQGYLEVYGQDVFVCQTKWWKNNRHLFQPYIFGERAWDNAFAAIMACHSKFHILYEDGLCYHFKHETNWLTGPYADYNMSIYSGADRSYHYQFHSFIMEVLNTPKNLLTFNNTADLIKKHFKKSDILNVNPHTVADVPQSISKPISSPVRKGLASIIVLIFQQKTLTRKCLDSIRKYTKEPHEIIFVLADPSFEAPKWLRNAVRGNAKNYRLSRCNEKISFSKACNRGINESSGEYIAIMDDSVMVTEGWLSGMLECLTSSEDTGIVGPLTVNIEGRQGIKIKIKESRGQALRQDFGVSAQSNAQGDRRQDFGVSAQSNAQGDNCHGEPVEPHTSSFPSDPGTLESSDPKVMNVFARSFRERNRYRRVYVKDVDSFCMLFRRSMTEKIGLLDERFETYESAGKDYCFTAAMEGFRNIIAGDVFVHFHGHKSLKSSPGSPSPLSKDRKILVEKWLDSKDPSLPESKKKYAMDTLFLSDELSQKGEKGNAILALEDAIKTDTENKRLRFAVAEILIGESKFKEALESLERMPDWMKTETKGLELIGFCIEGLHRASEAEKYADEVLKRNISSPGAWNLKGTVSFTRILYPDAEKFFRRALAADPAYGEAYANLGSLRWQQGKKEEAFGLFEKAFILTPTSEDIITNYYAAASYLSKLPDVEKIFREAIALYPSHRRLQFILIDNLLQQNKFEEAMKEMEGAMITFGIDDDTLNVALKLRERIETDGDSSGLVETAKTETHGDSIETNRDLISQSPDLNVSQRISISLCMIVKDEETNIMYALRSVKPVVNEMIVVDTGSTDRTKNIAKAFGAKVYDFPWNDNFSDARNFSLSKASEDWIFILDADEVISPMDHEKLRELVKGKEFSPRRIRPSAERGPGVILRQDFGVSAQSNAQDDKCHGELVEPQPLGERGQGRVIEKVAFSFISRNYVGSVGVKWKPNDGEYKEEAGSGWFPSEKVRLFPNNSRIRFDRPVHETVEDSLSRIGIEIRKIEIPIHHYGKPDMEQAHAKV